MTKTISTKPRRAERSQIEGRTFTRQGDDAGRTLAAILETASRQLGYDERTPPGFDEPIWRRKSPAVASGSLRMADLLPEIVASPSRPSSAPRNLAAGERVSLSQAIWAGSRCAQAGAHIIQLPEPRVIDGNTPALSEVPSGLRLVRPAPFSEIALVDGEGEVSTSLLEEVVIEGALDRATMNQIAFSVQVKRSAIRSVGEAQLIAEVLAAITMGIGEAIDARLLAAITATTPAAFTLGAAATKGLQFGELHAVVGTGGNGTTVDQGKLYAAGVPATLTPSTAATYVAAWNRFAVIVAPEIDVLMTRMDARGSVTLTCWLDAQAIIPDPGFVWAVA